LQVSRIFHRFGFGPRPGEFQQALKNGVSKSRSLVLGVGQESVIKSGQFHSQES
jgi:hypothetical protein